MADTAGQWPVLTDCYGRPRRPVAWRALIAWSWPTPQGLKEVIAAAHDDMRLLAAAWEVQWEEIELGEELVSMGTARSCLFFMAETAGCYVAVMAMPRASGTRSNWRLWVCHPHPRPRAGMGQYIRACFGSNTPWPLR